MTDNEIIKALECCLIPDFEGCDDCPCQASGCVNVLMANALDHIKRQQAEIERLEKCYALAVAEREANVKGFIESLKEAEGHNDPVGERGECGLKSQCLAEANAEIERLTINMNAFGLGMKREAERAEKAEAEIEEKNRILGLYALKYGTVTELEVFLTEGRVKMLEEGIKRWKKKEGKK